MLRSKVIPQVLQQAITSNDVKAVLLMKDDGSLISCAEAPNCDHNISKIVSAISSSIFTTYQRDDDLQFQLIDCEDGRFMVTRVAKLLLCIYSDASTEFGLLKLKAEKLREYLEEPLSQVEHVDGFRAAGVLLYCLTDNNKVKLLLALKNRIQEGNTESSLGYLPFGGKREKNECGSDTASREFNEETALIFNERIEEIKSKLKEPIPFNTGYFLYPLEINYNAELPQLYESARETLKNNESKMFKHVKKIERIEWIDLDDIDKKNLASLFKKMIGEIKRVLTDKIQTGVRNPIDIIGNKQQN
ncbi:putative mitogen-activated protein binding protein interacting protein [Heterostelium album PN500]|uniref:Putative mitogen-activated protein binding protein interacting protein n=1 Tax=Heterostelium pallidum (strain ATCC 26659 / Pp 5 / PN500) TaxID=670386 RepID=D3BRD9_HETP5|nr:putative mitogen-activated protein binding protein interacting protein [Heterostelium album PN500]EFA75971.1 putative mitogen-activated protein binding protein interacting protein [Heterostelium album PN500]|eukprot:XP_020428105.1 putative mitogen-activated protein binding protein interacting protein [Heterostelium album PN500]